MSPTRSGGCEPFMGSKQRIRSNRYPSGADVIAFESQQL
jgi:hypothetical protein